MGSDQSVATNSDIVGYQVVRVSPDSPAAKTGLCPYFDFIISLDDISIQNEEHTFVQEYITKSVNQPLKMQIFSTKTMTFRDVKLIPRKGENGLLGCTIRYESVRKSLDCVWHVLSVEKDSPAARAGLQSNTDYLVGSGDTLFKDSDDFHDLLSGSATKLRLFVYNLVSDSFREVIIDRGVNKHIGCNIGNGYIHQVPVNKEARIKKDGKIEKGSDFPGDVAIQPVDIKPQTMISITHTLGDIDYRSAMIDVETEIIPQNSMNGKKQEEKIVESEKVEKPIVKDFKLTQEVQFSSVKIEKSVQKESTTKSSKGEQETKPKVLYYT